MSDTFEWKPEYSIDVDSIDRQHQELFRIFNNLADAVADNSSQKAAVAAMHEMSQYLDKHFTFEEPLLKKHPDFDQHHLEHLKFIEKTLDFQIRFADQDTTVHMDMLAFLFDWLKKHILEMDKEYFTYLKENNLLDN